MKKPELFAAAVATLCMASVITILSWPKFQDGTWETVSLPTWWQFEWLAAIGVGLSALPSLAVAALSESTGISASMRYVVPGLLITLKIAALSFLVYKVAQRFQIGGHGPTNRSTRSRVNALRVNGTLCCLRIRRGSLAIYSSAPASKLA
jgi:hypothetical protein